MTVIWAGNGREGGFLLVTGEIGCRAGPDFREPPGKRGPGLFNFTKFPVSKRASCLFNPGPIP